jgi:L-ribulose-5-phosphate 3-epimerase
VSEQSLYLGGSTFPFMWQETAFASMRRLQRLGLNDVDVLLAPNHLWPNAATLASADELSRLMVDHGLRIDSLSLPALDFNLCSCVPEVRAFSVEIYRRAIELSAALGGRGVGVVPGRVSALLPPAEDASLEWLLESISVLADEAGRHGLCLFVETHPHTPVPTADNLASFLNGLDSRVVKIAYDIATATFTGEDYQAAISRHSSRIGQVHLSDSPRTTWRHDALGSGALNVGAALDAISNSGFAGKTILEIISRDPEAAIRRSLEVLSEYGCAA